MRRKVPEAVRELGGDSVEAGHEHQQTEVEQVLIGDLLAVDLPPNRNAQQVVARLGAALRDQLGEVTDHGHHGVDLPVLILIGHTSAVQDVDLPLLEQFGIASWQPHDVHEDRVRKPQRDVVHEVAGTLGGNIVKDLGEHLPDLRFQLGYGCRREQRTQ